MPTPNESELYADAATASDHRNPRRRRQQTAAEPEVGVLLEPTARDTMEALILHKSATEDILAGLRAIETRSQLESVWNISAISPQAGRCILNFYGPPGTGKTRAALAIASRLGKPVYQVDYSAVISKYLGDTAKHIVTAFKRAADLDAVLFFDEADSLLSRRVDAGESCATSINQNRNVLMQELDRFNGVVIMTTNLFGHYDPALLRRIARHIEFKPPTCAMRLKLFRIHLPNLARVDADLAAIARDSLGLCGGDILNVCLNAIYAASVSPDPETWRVSESHLRAEIAKVKASKEKHSNPTIRRPIGFQQEAELEN
jgi:SpoVK/Ycf46/Vps4 family AAA+-type ATPase